MSEPITSPDQEATTVTPPNGQPTAADMFAQIDFGARLRDAVEKTLNTRRRKLEERNDHLERRRHGKAAYHRSEAQPRPARRQPMTMDNNTALILLVLILTAGIVAHRYIQKANPDKATTAELRKLHDEIKTIRALATQDTPDGGR